ncbi:MAG: branched-chain-amino-acid transaminase [Actinobacteria bacterium]|nr:branched-chain-amino-acid transaminase [Actinomycetota bacterium]
MPIQKVKFIWMNGKFVPWDEANIHVLSHALHYGSGVFEGIRAYENENGTFIFRLKDHIIRLFESAKIYFMEIPYSIEEICEATKELLRKNELRAGYIRPIAFRGYGEMGLNPLNSPVDVVIATWPWGAYLGEEGIEKGIRAKISSFKRIDVNTLPPAAKATGQYINSILAKIEAIKDGYDEAILLDQRGFVSEGSGENIFIVKNGILYTPPSASGILKGITRDTVMKLSENLGYKVVEQELVRTDLYLADEVFFTGTAAEIVPIREIDHRTIGDGKPGPVVRNLQSSFKQLIQGKYSEFEDWLDYV